MTQVLLAESVALRDEVRPFLQHVQRETHARIAQLSIDTRQLQGATRESVVRALDDAEGVTFFTHGDGHRLVTADGGDLLTGADGPLLASRWCHAFACRTAEDGATDSLACLAAPHAEVYAGYASEIQALIYFDLLSETMRDRVTDLACALSLELASGQRERRALLAEVSRAWEALMDVLEDPSLEPFVRDSLFRLTDLWRTQLRLVGVGLR
jgi:hypothetical protein